MVTIRVTSQTRIEQAFHRLMTIIVVVRNRNGAKSWLTVRFPAFMGEPSILMGKQIATNNFLESFTYPYERKLRNYYKPEYRIISTIFQSEYIQ